MINVRATSALRYAVFSICFVMSTAASEGANKEAVSFKLSSVKYAACQELIQGTMIDPELEGFCFSYALDPIDLQEVQVDLIFPDRVEFLDVVYPPPYQEVGPPPKPVFLDDGFEELNLLPDIHAQATQFPVPNVAFEVFFQDLRPGEFAPAAEFTFRFGTNDFARFRDRDSGDVVQLAFPELGPVPTRAPVKLGDIDAFDQAATGGPIIFVNPIDQIVRLDSVEPLRSVVINSAQGNFRSDAVFNPPLQVPPDQLFPNLIQIERPNGLAGFVAFNLLNARPDQIDVTVDMTATAVGLTGEQLNVPVVLGLGRETFDFNGDGQVDLADRLILVEDFAFTFIGDANLDGVFDEQDLLQALAAGGYQDAATGNSSWATGDFNGDKEFTSEDLLLALQRGGFGRPPRHAVAVPEPTSLLLCWGLLLAPLRKARVSRSLRCRSKT